MGVAEGKPSLLAAAKEYIRVKYEKPGNVFLGTVSRLDAPVTGIVLFARTSKAAARLTKQFLHRDVEKTYWALVSGHVDPPQGACIDWLRKDERHRRVHICGEDAAGAQQARLGYRVLQDFSECSLLEIRLETGRKHQIRVQLSHRRHPILGDRKYGSNDPFPAGIALHARRLLVRHPTKKTDVEITSPLPGAWRRWVSSDLERQLADRRADR